MELLEQTFTQLPHHQGSILFDQFMGCQLLELLSK
jgi:hypothetical protein